ncbi:MAG: phosphotriesterase-related protein [Dehalococcoidia bacterium]|nr:phosphotriesterase-related protein [Dehalococcoidia bacterium]HCU99564.1 phosphotriesterase-related protein [Dehalococcoidia bacterium]|tara:strand:- start:1521 stop:2465 length:945 start_codon:yes stop_codon:yes gene_type:complete
MVTIPTAAGAIDHSDLGATLMHEHVFIRSPGVFEAWPELWDPDKEIANAVERFSELKDAGIDSIVDLTTIDLGRDAAMVAAVARQVKLNIVMCTGVWRQPPNLFRQMNSDEIADLFVRDIQEGIEKSDVCAGVIKLATQPTVDEVNEVMLRAGARAHRRTGVPISTHSDVSTESGLAQQDVFEREGVDLARVVIGHSGDSSDTGYLARIMDRGSVIGMDRFGIDRKLNTEGRVETIVKLCDMGYAGQMVLSHDTNCFMDTMPRASTEAWAPNWHFLHITNDVLPALRGHGVTETQINEMMVDNPQRIFSQQDPY